MPFIVPVCLAPGENSVVILQFGKWFDRFLAGVSLPCGLQELRFGTKFNEPLDNVDLPVTLQTLELGSGFQQSLRMLSCQRHSNCQTLIVGQHCQHVLDSPTLRAGEALLVIVCGI